MKVSIPALKNIRNTAEDEAESLENYLTNLYRDTEYKVKDKAYVENTALLTNYRKQ